MGRGGQICPLGLQIRSNRLGANRVKHFPFNLSYLERKYSRMKEHLSLPGRKLFLKLLISENQTSFPSSLGRAARLKWANTLVEMEERTGSSKCGKRQVEVEAVPCRRIDQQVTPLWSCVHTWPKDGNCNGSFFFSLSFLGLKGNSRGAFPTGGWLSQ